MRTSNRIWTKGHSVANVVNDIALNRNMMRSLTPQHQVTAAAFNGAITSARTASLALATFQTETLAYTSLRDTIDEALRRCACQDNHPGFKEQLQSTHDGKPVATRRERKTPWPYVPRPIMTRGLHWAASAPRASSGLALATESPGTDIIRDVITRYTKAMRTQRGRAQLWQYRRR